MLITSNKYTDAITFDIVNSNAISNQVAGELGAKSRRSRILESASGAFVSGGQQVALITTIKNKLGIIW